MPITTQTLRGQLQSFWALVKAFVGQLQRLREAINVFLEQLQIFYPTTTNNWRSTTKSCFRKARGFLENHTKLRKTINVSYSSTKISRLATKFFLPNKEANHNEMKTNHNI